MRFLADHDVYFMTIQELRRSGHDVITAKELQMQESDDSELLAKAKALDRIFISRDVLVSADYSQIELRIWPICSRTSGC